MSATIHTKDVSKKDKKVFLEILLFLQKELPNLQMEEEQRGRFSSQLEKIEHRLEDPFFNLAIIGDFSSGKSSFINAMLRSDLLKTAVLATTAIPTRIRWNAEVEIEILACVKQGQSYNLCRTSESRIFSRKFNIALPDGVSSCIDAVTTSNALADQLDEIEIRLPYSERYEHICLIDTPGVNPGASGTQAHIQQTQNVLRESADATLILFPSPQVYKASFGEFLRENAQHLLGDAIFVVTKMDIVPIDERDQMIEFVKGQLTKQFQLSSPEVYGCSPTCAIHPDKQKTWDPENWPSVFSRLENIILNRIRERRRSIVTSGVRRLLTQALESAKKLTDESFARLEDEKKLFERNSIEHFDAECDKILEEFKAGFESERQKRQSSLRQKIKNSISHWKDIAYSDINGCTNRNAEDKSGIAYIMKHEVPIDVSCSLDAVNDQMKGQTKPLLDKLESYITQLNQLLEKYHFNMSGILVDASDVARIQATDTELIDMKWSGPDVTAAAATIMTVTAIAALPIIGVVALLDSFLETDMIGSLDRLFGMLGVDSAKSSARSKVDTIFSDLEAKVVPSSMESFDTFCDQCIQQADEALYDYVKKYEDIFNKAREKFEAQSRRINAQFAVNKEMRDGIEYYASMVQKL